MSKKSISQYAAEIVALLPLGYRGDELVGNIERKIRIMVLDLSEAAQLNLRDQFMLSSLPHIFSMYNGISQSQIEENKKITGRGKAESIAHDAYLIAARNRPPEKEKEAA